MLMINKPLIYTALLLSLSTSFATAAAEAEIKMEGAGSQTSPTRALQQLLTPPTPEAVNAQFASAAKQRREDKRGKSKTAKETYPVSFTQDRIILKGLVNEAMEARKVVKFDFWEVNPQDDHYLVTLFYQLEKGKDSEGSNFSLQTTLSFADIDKVVPFKKNAPGTPIAFRKHIERNTSVSPKHSSDNTKLRIFFKPVEAAEEEAE